jgi:hypothetical protein
MLAYYTPKNCPSGIPLKGPPDHPDQMRTTMKFLTAKASKVSRVLSRWNQLLGLATFYCLTL